MALQYNQYVPVGYINNTTPQSATVSCGNVLQSATVDTDNVLGQVEIPFEAPASWCGAQWTPNELGLIWTCQVAGIYSFNISQNLTFQNVAELVNPTVSVEAVFASATTSEFNKYLETTLMVPITTDPITVQANLSGIVNVDVGTTLVVNVIDNSGNITTTSNEVAPPNAGGSLSWNLLAEGEYGNANVIVP
jgi:hypothetical protein